MFAFFKLIFKKYPRDELVRRVMLQYNYRSFHIHTRLNELDRRIIEVLIQLAVDSFYEVVRTEARQNLFFTLAQYPCSALAIVQRLADILRKSNDEDGRDSSPEGSLSKEQFEGCLLLLNGSAQHASFLVKQDWRVIVTLWPALFNCHYLENENVQHILDGVYANTSEM